MRKTAPTAHLAARLIAYEPFWWSANALLWILYHIWPLASGLLAKILFDTLQTGAAAGPNLATLTALVVAVGLGRAGVVAATSVTNVQDRFRVRALLQRNLLTHLIRTGSAAASEVGEATGLGGLLSTIRDDVESLGEMVDWFFDLTAGVLFALGGLAVLLSVDARITALVFTPVAMVIAVAQAARTRLVRSREASRHAAARVTEAIGEIFAAAETVQAAGAEEAVVEHLRRLGRERQEVTLRNHLQRLWLDAIFSYSADLGAGLVLLLAAGRMRTGAFSVGDFALFATYLLQVASFTSFLGYLVNTYRQAGVSVRRLVQIVEPAPAATLTVHERIVWKGPAAEPTKRTTPRAAVPSLASLRVQGLTYVHPLSDRGVRGISFTLKRGTLTVVTGRVGSGKTTLLRVLLGLLPPQAGAVFWNDSRITDPGVFFVPPHTAYTAQSPVLLSGSLRDNILLGLPDEPDRLADAVWRAVLEPDLASFPAALDTPVGPHGIRLSGGQAKRVAAARMLVRRPDLLVLDDVASALDVETNSVFWERLLADGATCLAVSHQPHVLARADQVLILEDGRLAACGPPTEVLRTIETLRHLLQLDP